MHHVPRAIRFEKFTKRTGNYDKHGETVQDTIFLRYTPDGRKWAPPRITSFWANKLIISYKCITHFQKIKQTIIKMGD